MTNANRRAARIKICAALCAGVIAVAAAIAIGSVRVPLGDAWAIIAHRVFGAELREGIRNTTVTILWNSRLPRALLAFIAGAALSVSGAVMQSALRNPLASSYTLGVSSGASFGASLVILFGFSLPFLPGFSLPVMGFVFGLATILIATAFASRIDGRMENNTIILTGMVFSLFITAMTTLMSAMAREQVQRLVFWQMGSFAMKGWQPVAVLAPMTLAGVLFIAHYNRELDIMTFGEEQARTMGVNLKRVKWTLLLLAAALTGSAIAFTGVIGFVDLVAPHVVRRIFGPAHRLVIPMSAVAGGTFMVVCDLAARTVVSPGELPVGAVTAIIGAPFFAYIYFGKRRKI